jgi:hypothetical protein
MSPSSIERLRRPRRRAHRGLRHLNHNRGRARSSPAADDLPNGRDGYPGHRNSQCQPLVPSGVAIAPVLTILLNAQLLGGVDHFFVLPWRESRVPLRETFAFAFALNLCLPQLAGIVRFVIRHRSKIDRACKADGAVFIEGQTAPRTGRRQLSRIPEMLLGVEKLPRLPVPESQVSAVRAFDHNRLPLRPLRPTKTGRGVCMEFGPPRAPAALFASHWLRRGSNPHGGYPPQDFKSTLSVSDETLQHVSHGKTRVFHATATESTRRKVCPRGVCMEFGLQDAPAMPKPSSA